MLESGAGLVDVLTRAEASNSETTSAMMESPSPVAAAAKDSIIVTAGSDNKAKGRSHMATKNEKSTRKRSNQKVIDRRRRRGQRLPSSGSSGEEEDEVCGRSSSDSLSMLSDDHSDEDIQVLDSLSDSSPSEDEQKPLAPGPSLPGSTPSLPPSGPSLPGSTHSLSPPSSAPAAKQSTDSPPKPHTSGRRQIVLAASFNLAPTKDLSTSDLETTSAKSSTAPLEAVDGLLKKVYSQTVYESIVHTACSILTEDSYLIPIRTFTEWLHSYSIVIATCREVTCVHALLLFGVIIVVDNLSDFLLSLVKLSIATQPPAKRRAACEGR